MHFLKNTQCTLACCPSPTQSSHRCATPAQWSLMVGQVGDYPKSGKLLHFLDTKCLLLQPNSILTLRLPLHTLNTPQSTSSLDGMRCTGLHLYMCFLCLGLKPCYLVTHVSFKYSHFGRFFCIRIQYKSNRSFAIMANSERQPLHLCEF